MKMSPENRVTILSHTFTCVPADVAEGNRQCMVSDLLAATLVRPGSLAEVVRMQCLGACIVSHGIHRDGETGAQWPCVVVRLGRARVVIVLDSAEGNERAQHPPGRMRWRDGWTVAA